MEYNVLCMLKGQSVIVTRLYTWVQIQSYAILMSYHLVPGK